MWYDDDDDEGSCCSCNPSYSSPVMLPLKSAIVAKNAVSNLAMLPHSPAGWEHEVPGNMYWLVPNKLLGMASPKNATHVRNLHYLHKVRMIINLKECPIPREWLKDVPISYVHLPIKSFGAPNFLEMEFLLEQMDAFFESDGDGAVAVHCMEGKGRTGTVLACYLIHKFRISAAEAINQIRLLSARSIESTAQEKFIDEFARLLLANERSEMENGVASIGGGRRRGLTQGCLASRRQKQPQMDQNWRCKGRQDEDEDDEVLIEDGDWYSNC